MPESKASANIFILSMQPDLAERIRSLFPESEFSFVHESKPDKVLDYFRQDDYDIFILTTAIARQGDKSCYDLINTITDGSPMTQVLLLAEPDDIEFAIASLHAGTYQYTKMPVSDKELTLLIQVALEQQPQFAENTLLEESVRDHFEQILGRSKQMRQVFRQIRLAASADIPVLLLGETGTGKDLVAQALHAHSAVKNGPYVPVNLGAIPTQLVASELFGHEKGAFTGALKRHEGKFEQANGGTVFLDEIDSIDEKVQVSLLRLIEQKQFHRLAGQAAIRTDARLISASNQNLEELVAQGKFREDLFYRIDVFRIAIPPLRKRSGDIPLLAQRLLQQFSDQFNKRVVDIQTDAMAMLESYDWPGNVRELKNAIQRAVLVCPGDTLKTKHFPPRFLRSGDSGDRISFSVGTTLESVEKQMIVRALEDTGNNRKRAAELLGISRRAIYNKLRKHNLE